MSCNEVAKDKWAHDAWSEGALTRLVNASRLNVLAILVAHLDTFQYHQCCGFVKCGVPISFFGLKSLNHRGLTLDTLAPGLRMVTPKGPPCAAGSARAGPDAFRWRGWRAEMEGCSLDNP